MKPNWHVRWRILAAATDLIFVGGALVVWTAARFGAASVWPAFVPASGRDFGRAPLLFAIPVWLSVFAALRLYSPQRMQNGLEEARNLVTAGLGAAVALVMLGFVVKENPARSWLIGAMVLGTLGAAVGRQTTRTIVSRLRARGNWMTPTVIVGRRQAKSVVEAVLHDTASGVKPVGTCGFVWSGLPSWEVADGATAVRETNAAQMIVVAEDLERREVAGAIEVADDLPLHVVVLPGLDHLLLASLRLVTVVHEPGLALETPSLRGYQAAVKRVLDVAAAALLLILTAPIAVAAALAVRIDSRGPLLFRQLREGEQGSTFEALKFRTMHHGTSLSDVETNSLDGVGFAPKDKDDPRITRLGRFLRRTSLDELPQLWNVLRGDMSLVGPRPLRLWEAQRLALHRRLVVRPGLTGLWQVSGRSSLSPEERIRLDLVYVQNWSLLLDLSILLRTVPAVIRRRGAF